MTDHALRPQAVLLCAGLGSRLQPFTKQLPKPLLPVGGVTLLERTVHYLREAGIRDITIVTGYRHEAFDEVARRMGLRTFFNPDYARRNNHSSVAVLGKAFADTFIIDGDLLLTRNVFTEILEDFRLHGPRSGFVVQRTRKGASEWEVIEEGGVLRGVRKNSAEGWSLSGVSYWRAEEAERIRERLAGCGADAFWEDCVLELLQATPPLPVRVWKTRDFQVEIDAFVDALRAGVMTPEEVAVVCSERPPERLESLSNDTFLVVVDSEEQVLRVPNVRVDGLIDRTVEARVLALLRDFPHAVPATFYAGGLKVSPFCRQCRLLSESGDFEADVGRLMTVLAKLHAVPVPPDAGLPKFSVRDEVLRYEASARVSLLDDEEHDEILAWAEEMDRDPKVLCHRDLVPENVLVTPDSVELIDFEYAAVTSPYWDLASFLTENPGNERFQMECLRRYGDVNPIRVERAKAVVSYVWALWGFHRRTMAYGRKRLADFDRFRMLGRRQA